jgi:hypothetical protein
MTETIKKTKAPAKPRKTAAKKSEVTAIDQPKIDQPKIDQSEVAQAKVVPHEEVARLAHRFWAERGRQHGHHVDDWFRAEQELRGKAS